MRAYFIPMNDGDSNDVILGWKNSHLVYNITTNVEYLHGHNQQPMTKKLLSSLEEPNDNNHFFAE